MKAKVELLTFKEFLNEKGSLIALEEMANIPFQIKRIYYIFNSEGNLRGLHAHKQLKQVLICVSGSCSVKVEYNGTCELYQLSKENQGLLIEGLVWREMFDFKEDTVLIVLASELYNPQDYIFDYNEFKKFKL